MNVTLAKEDRRAVDLLLDRGARAAGNAGNGNGNGKGHAVFASADASLGERVARAQRLLQLLELMPGGEPPADLTARTLRFVEQQSTNRPGAMRPEIPQLIDNAQRPHA